MINGPATQNRIINRGSLAEDWWKAVVNFKEYNIDFYGIDTSNTNITVGPVYEGKHEISLCRSTDWTSGCTDDLTFDLWLCRISPPATLR